MFRPFKETGLCSGCADRSYAQRPLEKKIESRTVGGNVGAGSKGDFWKSCLCVFTGLCPCLVPIEFKVYTQCNSIKQIRLVLCVKKWRTVKKKNKCRKIRKSKSKVGAHGSQLVVRAEHYSMIRSQKCKL